MGKICTMNSFLIKSKKGMEMWQLVMIILAVMLLLFVIAWYSGLNDQIRGLLDKLTGLLG